MTSENLFSVLIIESDPQIEDILKRVLIEDGVPAEQLITASTQKEVYQKLLDPRATRLTAVLFDLDLKELDGFMLLRDLRRGDSPNKDTPIIVLSGENDESIEQYCRQNLKASYIKKPFEIEEIPMALKEIKTTSG